MCNRIDSVRHYHRRCRKFLLLCEHFLTTMNLNSHSHIELRPLFVIAIVATISTVIVRASFNEVWLGMNKKNLIFSMRLMFYETVMQRNRAQFISIANDLKLTVQSWSMISSHKSYHYTFMDVDTNQFFLVSSDVVHVRRVQCCFVVVA